MRLGLGFTVTRIETTGAQQLYVSFLTTEDSQPIVDEANNNLIRENL